MPQANLLTGEVDISAVFLPSALTHIDAGKPLVILAGQHLGCVELFATNRVRSTADLKGKTVKVEEFNSDEHIFISLFVAYVGLDPRKDINWVFHSYPDGLRLFKEGKIDAFMSGPPLSQELRDKKVGHVLVDNATDKPWSQYFCCVIATTPEFVRKYPAATKRALRAFLKGAAGSPLATSSTIQGKRPAVGSYITLKRGRRWLIRRLPQKLGSRTNAPTCPSCYAFSRMSLARACRRVSARSCSACPGRRAWQPHTWIAVYS